MGDGPIRQTLEQKALKMERVVFTGWQDPEPFYRDASILCLTSDFEAVGNGIDRSHDIRGYSGGVQFVCSYHRYY